MISINETELNEMIESADKTLVLFSAEWCGPCKVLKPSLEKIEEEFKEFYKFVKADIEENEENTVRFAIKNIPTCVLVKEGKEIARFTGVKTLDQIKIFLGDHNN